MTKRWRKHDVTDTLSGLIKHICPHEKEPGETSAKSVSTMGAPLIVVLSWDPIGQGKPHILAWRVLLQVSFALSNLTESKLPAYLDINEVKIAVEDVKKTDKWEFSWASVGDSTDENAHAPRARTYLEEKLKEVGVQFGENEIALHDVHNTGPLWCASFPKILDTVDSWVIRLKGRPDCTITPHKADPSFLAARSKVVFDFKTEKGFQKVSARKAQGIGTLITASSLSKYTVIVVITDLNEQHEIYCMPEELMIERMLCTGDEMLKYVLDHLNHYRKDTGKIKTPSKSRKGKQKQSSRRASASASLTRSKSSKRSIAESLGLEDQMEVFQDGTWEDFDAVYQLVTSRLGLFDEDGSKSPGIVPRQVGPPPGMYT